MHISAKKPKHRPLLCFLVVCGFADSVGRVLKKRNNGYGVQESRTAVFGKNSSHTILQGRYVRGLTWKRLIWYARVRITQNFWLEA